MASTTKASNASYCLKVTSTTRALWHTLSPLIQRRTMPRNKVVPHPCNQFNTRRKESNLLLLILPQPATIVAVFIWLLPLHTKRRCAGTAKPKATWTGCAVLRLTLLQKVTFQPLVPHRIRSLLRGHTTSKSSQNKRIILAGTNTVSMPFTMNHVLNSPYPLHQQYPTRDGSQHRS